MRLAGELVLVRNQQIINIHQSGGINRGIIQKLDKVTTELQETIIQTRLQPIASLFGKFPRVIRELNRKTQQGNCAEAHAAVKLRWIKQY